MADITLYAYYKPTLASGTYTVKYNPVVKIDGAAVTPPVPAAPLSFKVAAPAANLQPQEVDSVFPPDGGLGTYDHVLPHIAIRRVTLPWEVKLAGDPDAPWLALLVVADGEATITTEAKGNLSVSRITFAAVPSDKLPATLAEAKKLCHARMETDRRLSAVIATRPPVISKKNTVYLVSLEGMYDANGKLTGKSFISLYSWSFFCQEHFRFSASIIAKYSTELGATLTANLKKIINQDFYSWAEVTAALSSPAPVVLTDDQKRMIEKYFDLGHLLPVLSHLSTGFMRLPDNTTPALKPHQKAGFAIMDYTTVEGVPGKVVYRSPFAPLKVVLKAAFATFPMGGSADDYLQVDKTPASAILNIPEISLSAAWQIGRMLTLQNKTVSTALYKWKNECYQTILSLTGTTTVPVWKQPVQLLRDWFVNLSRFRGIPFQYLVPDERLLPTESIRFFYTDPNWIRCLLDGAFSIARFSMMEKALFDPHLWPSLDPKTAPSMGFIMRSVAVSGWPDLVVEGIDKVSKAAVAPDTRFLAGPDVLICLFKQDVTQVNIRTKPEAMHFEAKDEKGADKKTTALKSSNSAECASILAAQVGEANFNLV